MAKKVGARRQGRKDEQRKEFVMVIKGGRSRIEERDNGKVVSSHRVTRRNRYKG